MIVADVSCRVDVCDESGTCTIHPIRLSVNLKQRYETTVHSEGSEGPHKVWARMVNDASRSVHA